MNEQDILNRREFLSQTALAGAALTGAALLPAPTFAAAAPRGDREKVRVGLIGCGSVSGAYLPNLNQN